MSTKQTKLPVLAELTPSGKPRAIKKEEGVSRWRGLKEWTGTRMVGWFLTEVHLREELSWLFAQPMQSPCEEEGGSGKLKKWQVMGSKE